VRHRQQPDGHDHRQEGQRPGAAAEDQQRQVMAPEEIAAAPEQQLQQHHAAEGAVEGDVPGRVLAAQQLDADIEHREQQRRREHEERSRHRGVEMYQSSVHRTVIP